MTDQARCPSCGSTDPKVRRIIPAWRDTDENGTVIQSDDDVECYDDWHIDADLRCPTCGCREASPIAGRCPDAWHVSPKEGERE